jgi:hypothetical protein
MWNWSSYIWNEVMDSYTSYYRKHTICKEMSQKLNKMKKIAANFRMCFGNIILIKYCDWWDTGCQSWEKWCSETKIWRRFKVILQMWMYISSVAYSDTRVPQLWINNTVFTLKTATKGSRFTTQCFFFVNYKNWMFLPPNIIIILILSTIFESMDQN